MYDKIKVLTFATNKYYYSQKKLIEHLNNIGLNNLISLTDSDLPELFFDTHKKHFEYSRGYGYWIWKPYIIKNNLEKLKSDEIILYIDCGDIPSIKFFNFILDHFKTYDYLFLNRGYNHGQWTKRDCFHYMECDDENFYNQTQLEAGVFALKNTSENHFLLDEWYTYMNDLNILTDNQNICGLDNLKNFIEHRHDQSILTNLIIKKNLKHFLLSNDYILYNKNQ